MRIFFGLSFVGLAIGPVLGGVIVGALGWQWIFWLNLPVILISFLICMIHVPESRNAKAIREMDYPGMVLLIVSISSLVLVMTQVNTWGLVSPGNLRLIRYFRCLFHFVIHG